MSLGHSGVSAVKSFDQALKRKDLGGTSLHDSEVLVSVT